MSALNAFLATWSGARQTFGEGSPFSGAQFDRSGLLRQLQATVESAAPGARWTGTAASAYAMANHDHGQVLGRMADLEQRLVTELDQSAAVVAAGRRDLDAVRKWVLDMAATTQQTSAGEQMLLPVVQRGISDVSDIVIRSNIQLNEIGERIRGIAGEYQALGNRKFAGGAGAR